MNSTKEKLESAGAALGLLTTLGSALATAIQSARNQGHTEEEIQVALDDPAGVGQEILDRVTERTAKIAKMRRIKQ